MNAHPILLAHQPRPVSALEQRQLADDLRRASALLDAHPDAAALLLDGVLRRISIAALARERLVCWREEDLFDALAVRNQRLAYLLRLALRAPNLDARLAHCQQLYAALYGHDLAVVRAPAIDGREQHVR
ncbi:MAG: hypothetical protein OJF49_000468 [Ktedonobacterales bacterium]|nr:MAG: hypothetical protein OJF49_000468 [Ktedonobacterales bacterium]